MLSSLAYNFFSTCFFGLIIFLLSYYVVNLVSSYFRPPATYPRPAAAACVTGGQRGLINFEVEITCAKQDLHSGSYGGSVPEAMTDLVCLLSQLTDSTELMAITAPGIEKDLEQPTDEQRKLLRNSNFSINEAQKSHGIRHLIVRDKEAWLLATCWKPSISFHGIEGAFDGPGEKTVIPAKVIGKFSIRTGPGQRPGIIAGLVNDHIEKVFKRMHTPNKIVTRYEPQICISNI